MVMKRCEEVLGHKVQGASIYQSSQSPVGKMFGYRLSGKAASSGSSRGNATGFTHHASVSVHVYVCTVFPRSDAALEL